MRAKLPNLRTCRLLLRPLTLEDAEAVRRKAGTRAVAENTLHIPHPYPPGAAESWIRGLRKAIAAGDSAVFGVCDGESEELLGVCGLQIHKTFRSAELGYWLEEACWGRGLMTEAVCEVVRFAFEELDLEKVHAHHLLRNPASGRVLEKAGMRHEGVRRKHIVKWGKREDIANYGLLREDWELNP